MNNLNTVLMEGTLIRDPERSHQVTGSSACRISLANNRYYNDRNEKWVNDASFFTVWVFGPVAESCLTYLKKGRGIRVVGRLKQFRYTSAGLGREKVAILAEHIEFQPQKKTEDPAATEVPKLPGEVTTRLDSSLDMEKQSQERQADQPVAGSDVQSEAEAIRTKDDGEQDFAAEGTRAENEPGSEDEVPETVTAAADEDEPF
ncbi:MAG: single-stranded DNA-binding protein [Spirochaetales bacterium]|nr:single-stranded DNA-binding protein [Spirochaetales bacterium]